MIIEKIKYDEKKSLFTIKLDTKEEFNISYEVYEKYSLKEEQSVDVELYNKLEKENDYQTARRAAENYINYKSRTTQELINKLRTITNNDESINKIVQYYTKLDLLNDKRYAEEFVRTYLIYKNESKTKTKYKLIQKGINLQVINQILEEYDEDIEFENIKIVFDKKYKNKDLTDYTEKQKAFRYLSSRGFNYDAIKKVIE